MADLYAQFDGDEIDGKRYALGDKIDDSVDAATRGFLIDAGRLSASAPARAFTMPVAVDKPVGDMTRDELVEAILAGGASRLATMDDAALRDAVERDRAGQAPTGDSSTSDNAPPPPPPPPSLSGMTTAQLEKTAADEGVDISSASTNAERASMIEAARSAKS